jgi:Ran GTPase-activating protein (RanGAP) involved in mRNA processing and transport
MVAGVHDDPALQMLRAICDISEHCTIKHVNLSYNALGNHGLDTCHSMLGQQQNNLEVVKFVDNGFAAESMALHEDWLAGSKHLTTLIFENQMAGSEGAMHFARIVASCPLLTTIKYAQARCHDCRSPH